MPDCQFRGVGFDSQSVLWKIWTSIYTSLRPPWPSGLSRWLRIIWPLPMWVQFPVWEVKSFMWGSQLAYRRSVHALAWMMSGGSSSTIKAGKVTIWYILCQCDYKPNQTNILFLTEFDHVDCIRIGSRCQETKYNCNKFGTLKKQTV